MKKVNGFTLMNHEKVNRAIFGAISQGGQLKGGVGEKEVFEKKPENKDKDWDDAVLAQYDKLAGYITKDGKKVKTSSFYDFKNRKPREKPEVVFVFRDLAGKVVEIAEGKDVPMEVQAATMAKNVKKVKKVVKK